MTDDERTLLERLVAESTPRPSVLQTVSRILDELSPELMPLVAIGARDASEERVGRDVETALADSRFRVFDLRRAADADGIAALAADVGAAVRLLLIDEQTASEWLGPLVRAVLDDRDRIEFPEGWVARAAGSIVVVVQYGAAGIDDLALLLGEAPIVQFV